MKTLILTKVETKNKAAKFTYNVIEDGVVLAERKSNREYVACYVSQYAPGKFELPYFFGRIDLIGKGDSGKRGTENYYGLAIL